mmetsp:Transcript_9904/g.1466  ORF Transcript_9904/g.1466 Transcript_9904/m.1466 type:complete len:137 (-) Transcript_9904:44-454(-)
MFYSCNSCTDIVPELSYLMLSFLILGYASILLPVVIIAVICISLCMCICVQVYQARRRRNNEMRQTEIQLEMMKPKKYQGEPVDCSICTEIIDSSIKVVVMPCDDRHVFHEECIKSWLWQNPRCPICRANVCDYQI